MSQFACRWFERLHHQTQAINPQDDQTSQMKSKVFRAELGTEIRDMLFSAMNSAWHSTSLMWGYLFVSGWRSVQAACLLPQPPSPHPHPHSSLSTPCGWSRPRRSWAYAPVTSRDCGLTGGEPRDSKKKLITEQARRDHECCLESDRRQVLKPPDHLQGKLSLLVVLASWSSMHRDWYDLYVSGTVLKLPRQADFVVSSGTLPR